MIEGNQTTIAYLLFYLTGALLLNAFIVMYIVSRKKT